MDWTTEFHKDILITAVEGGINYWAAVNAYDPDAGKVTVYELDDDGQTILSTTQVDDHQIGKAVRRILNTDFDVAMADTYRKDVADAAKWLDAGDIDAMLADCIVQVACFGRVVYG